MSAGPFSIEAVVLGRNDEYEPGWTDRLHASLRYNRALFKGTPVDFRVAFVEWNPPPDRPLLSPGLVERFPFLRALVIDPSVHDALCTAADLTMMLNFAYNPALRTSQADYTLITSGDLFFGRALAARMAQGLRTRCLYRAERVNIADDLDLGNPAPDVIEDPGNIVSIDTCSEPPYDKPPYSHASGDFLLVDRVTMAGLRGFDESIRWARLHLDSRFCFTAMHAGLDCELAGRIFHINHRNAYTNRRDDYPGRSYDYSAGLPYLNAPDWGLARFEWSADSERLWRIGIPTARGHHWMPPSLSGTEVDVADEMTHRLALLRAALQPEAPLADSPSMRHQLQPEALTAAEQWLGAGLTVEGTSATVRTAPVPWGFSARTLLPHDFETDAEWHWIRLEGSEVGGEVGIGVLRHDQLLCERLIGSTRGNVEIWLPFKPAPDQYLLIRNGQHDGPSTIRIHTIDVVAQRTPTIDTRHLLSSLPEMGVHTR